MKSIGGCQKEKIKIDPPNLMWQFLLALCHEKNLYRLVSLYNDISISIYLWVWAFNSSFTYSSLLLERCCQILQHLHKAHTEQLCLLFGDFNWAELSYIAKIPNKIILFPATWIPRRQRHGSHQELKAHSCLYRASQWQELLVYITDSYI